MNNTPRRRSSDNIRWWQRDLPKLSIWAMATIFGAGVFYAQVQSWKDQQEEQLQAQGAILASTVETLNKTVELVAKISTQMEERTGTFRADHARYDAEINRLRNQVDAISQRIPLVPK